MEKTKENNLKLAAIKLAQIYHNEQNHSLHVAKLSISLFDQFVSLHQLTKEERALLETAAILHDIGWINGQQKHHKTSCDLIIRSEKLEISKSHRILIGLIARYHRKSLPKDSHPYFCDLDARSKKTVKILSAFLRISDGFDRMHQTSIENVLVEFSPEKITLNIKGKNILLEDIKTGKEKADLLQNVFKKRILIRQN